MPTRFQIWKQAIADLERAIAELGQVRASLKDIGLHDVGTSSFRKLNIEDLVFEANNLLAELRVAACDDCCHAIAKHGTAGGCDAIVLLLSAPCGCRWGLQEAKQ
jgi:hypothetical protein